MNRTASRKLREPWKLIEKRLLSIGGQKVELEPSVRKEINEAGEKLVRARLAAMREWPTEGRTVVAGWPNACEINTLPRWLHGEGDLVQGFALRAVDQTWWTNNWIGRPDGTVLDSLPGHVAYFGEVCNDPAEWNPAMRDFLEVYRLAHMPGVRPWITLVGRG
jgi:hypothetical protein